ncbi:hypothetical protein DPMN_024823 [Dreissena polymorpha]|uniref:Uncharacterized protein n=1 Tax=Dreissena polymorpha TaxID=45954 RepID=A0A9D4RD11_DREPO|nr:hypothetical protein DPMN_024823 [Dreissena polymorpha]
MTPHVFLPIETILELNRCIQETNVLTKFNEDWTKNVTYRRKLSRPPGGHVFSPIWAIFELFRDIFHDDWAKIVTSRVFTRNTAQPPGGHVCQRTGAIFELNQHIITTYILTKLHEAWSSNVTSTVITSFCSSFELGQCIIGTNVLTKFHEDLTRNVASTVFTRQNVDDGRTTDGRRTKGDPKSSP